MDVSVPHSTAKAYITLNSYKGDSSGTVNVFCDGSAVKQFTLGAGHGLTKGCDATIVQTKLEAALRQVHENPDGASKGQRRTLHQYQSEFPMYVHSLVY